MIFLIILNIGLIPQQLTPPGTIKVGGFYVDKTEILNIHWLEYQYYLKQELDESEYWKISPDSSNTWYDALDRRYEPIVLINHRQANDYCEWRSRVVSEKQGFNITYRLPTPEEWNLIAEAILNEKEDKILKSLSKLKKKLDKSKGEYFLQSRESPRNHLYDLFSNVTEMTAIKGIAKGGNNYELLDPKNLKTIIKYTQANPYLGFRCIAEITDAKK